MWDMNRVGEAAVGAGALKKTRVPQELKLKEGALKLCARGRGDTCPGW